MCAKFWLSAIIYANVIAKNSFSSGKKKTLVPGLKLLEFFWSVQNLCCNDSKYHSFNWKDFSVTNVEFFEKKQFSLQFSIAYSVQSFFYFRVRLY